MTIKGENGFMGNKFKELGFWTKDSTCPHCTEEIRENFLDELLHFEGFTEFKCPHCNQWIKGICDFEFMSADMEYHLLAIELIESAKKLNSLQKNNLKI